jgi:hypothetical protein
MGRFEAMNGNGVSSGPNLEAKGMRKALKDFKGTFVKGGQGRMGWWRQDKNVRGIEEVQREVKGLGIGLRSSKRAGKGMMEARTELGGIILREKGKLGGKY